MAIIPTLQCMTTTPVHMVDITTMEVIMDLMIDSTIPGDMEACTDIPDIGIPMVCMDTITMGTITTGIARHIYLLLISMMMQGPLPLPEPLHADPGWQEV